MTVNEKGSISALTCRVRARCLVPSLLPHQQEGCKVCFLVLNMLPSPQIINHQLSLYSATHTCIQMRKKRERERDELRMTARYALVGRWEKMERGVLTIERSGSRDPSGVAPVYSFLIRSSRWFFPFSRFCSVTPEYLPNNVACVFPWNGAFPP